MPEMSICSCLIRPGGDIRTQVQPADRGFGFGVVSFPELEVLRYLHGVESVSDVEAAGSVTSTAKREKERLIDIYGNQAVEAVFPGQNPQMQLLMELDDEEEAAAPPPVTRKRRKAEAASADEDIG